MGNVSKDIYNVRNSDLPIKKSDLNLVNRETKVENTIVEVAGIRFGGNKKVVIAGPVR